MHRGSRRERRRPRQSYDASFILSLPRLSFSSSFSPPPPPPPLPPPRRTLTLSHGSCDEARLSPSHTNAQPAPPAARGLHISMMHSPTGVIPGGSLRCTYIKAAVAAGRVCLASPLVNFFIFCRPRFPKKKTKNKKFHSAVPLSPVLKSGQFL